MYALKRLTRAACLAAVILGAPSPLAADPDDALGRYDLTLPYGVGWAADPEEPAGTAAGAAEEEAWKKDSPISLAIDYALVSDYIWRGINFSEYPGEGREKLNHQLGSGFGIDTPIGTIGAYAWFQWYQAQKRINPEQSDHLQEIDYTLSWGYGFDEIGTSLELGWVSYTFPHLSGDAFATYEVYGKVSA